MIKVNTLINLLKKNNTNFFTGVPDSVLKELSSYLKNQRNHIIATSEGSAVSIGIGHYLSTKKIPCIYMQNSGLSNALNPLISIAHKKVYSIPLILIIGWRGSPKVKDEPQHNVKGKITREILKLLNIKYTILRSNKDFKKFDKQIKHAKKNNTIVACLIEQGTLHKNSKSSSKKDFYSLDKEYFLKTLIKEIPTRSKVISSTGYNSRELMYLRKKFNLNKSKDFYMVGGMGHTSSVALGYSLVSKNNTFCIDGDGAFLMHTGSIAEIGSRSVKRFKHIVINNGCHDSVGGQPTRAGNIDLEKIASSFGYKVFPSCKSKDALIETLEKFMSSQDCSFLEIKANPGFRNNLGRPTTSPEENKVCFMQSIQK